MVGVGQKKVSHPTMSHPLHRNNHPAARTTYKVALPRANPSPISLDNLLDECILAVNCAANYSCGLAA